MQAIQDSHSPPPLIYEDTVVRQLAFMAVVWGVVGMLVGVVIAAQLTWPQAPVAEPRNVEVELRPGELRGDDHAHQHAHHAPHHGHEGQLAHHCVFVDHRW